jgi:hypothetical protein
MRRTTAVVVAVAAGGLAGCSGGGAAPPAPVPAAPRVVQVDGAPLEVAVQAAFPGTAGRSGPVLWVQVKLRNAAGQMVETGVPRPFRLVDAAGRPDGRPTAALLPSQVELQPDPERPALPLGTELAPGETVVGFLAFEPAGDGFTPHAVRYEQGRTAVDWPLAGLPAQPVVEPVAAPVAAATVGQAVELAGSDAGTAPGGGDKPLVDTRVRVRLTRVRPGDAGAGPLAGFRGVLATLEITNTGRHPYWDDPALHLHAMDGTGAAFRLAPAAGSAARGRLLLPGQTNRADVALFVPDRGTVKYIRFALHRGDYHVAAWWTLT